MSRFLLTIGDAPGSADQAAAALAVAKGKGNWAWAAEPLLTLVDALFALGRIDEVGPLVAELSENLDQVDAPLAQAALGTCRAIVVREGGDTGTADSLLDDARQILAEAGLRYDEARASERLGAWRCSDGSPGGPAMLEHALRTYGELPASRDIARVCRTMRQSAYRSRTRGEAAAARTDTHSRPASVKWYSSPPAAEPTGKSQPTCCCHRGRSRAISQARSASSVANHGLSLPPIQKYEGAPAA